MKASTSSIYPSKTGNNPNQLPGGVVLWDIKERAAIKTFEMVLPPGMLCGFPPAWCGDFADLPTGSPGGSSYTDPVGRPPSAQQQLR